MRTIPVLVGEEEDTGGIFVALEGAVLASIGLIATVNESMKD